MLQAIFDHFEGAKNKLNSSFEIKLYSFIIIIFFLLLLNIITYITISNQYHGAEGKLKFILPDGKLVIMDIMDNESEELHNIFPQISRPFCGNATFATDGEVESEYRKDTLDGRKNYTKIRFHNYEDSLDSNSGWMIRTLYNYNAQNFKWLSFWVKGDSGGEIIGIKIKDSKTVEKKVEVTSYTEGKPLFNRWQKIIIPLEHFLPVDKSNISTITIYTNGIMCNSKDQIIYITDFELY